MQCSMVYSYSGKIYIHEENSNIAHSYGFFVCRFCLTCEPSLDSDSELSGLSACISSTASHYNESAIAWGCIASGALGVIRLPSYGSAVQSELYIKQNGLGTLVRHAVSLIESVVLVACAER